MFMPSSFKEIAGCPTCDKFSCATFTPTPITTPSMPEDVTTASLKMPQSFFPLASTSLGHLSQAFAPSSSAAVQTQTAISCVKLGKKSVRCGLTKTEKYNPPSCEIHLRSKRPRPAVCLSAQTTVPSASCGQLFFK